MSHVVHEARAQHPNAECHSVVRVRSLITKHGTHKCTRKYERTFTHESN